MFSKVMVLNLCTGALYNPVIILISAEISVTDIISFANNYLSAAILGIKCKSISFYNLPCCHRERR